MLRLHNSDGAESPRHDGVPALVASAPLLELLDQTADDIECLEELTPDNPAIDAYRRLYRELWAALDDAADQPVWVSTKQAAHRLNVSQSHVQHLCDQDSSERPFKARKVGNVWRIDARTLSGAEKTA